MINFKMLIMKPVTIEEKEKKKNQMTHLNISSYTAFIHYILEYTVYVSII